MTTTTHPFLNFGEAVALRVAVADQRDTIQRMSAQDMGHRMDARHEWFRGLGVEVLDDLMAGKARLCPHIGPGRGLGPMYTVMGPRPLRVDCRCCFARRPRFGPVDDNTCDRCSVYARGGLVGGALPVGPLLILFGVCGTCATDLDMRQAKDDAPRAGGCQ